MVALTNLTDFNKMHHKNTHLKHSLREEKNKYIPTKTTHSEKQKQYFFALNSHTKEKR